MPEYDPLVTFHFSVEVANVTVGAFTEIELPSFEVDTQEIKEGGLNGFSHTLAGPLKQGRVTLKKGLVRNDVLLNWYLQIMQGNFGERTLKSVAITMFARPGRDEGNEFKPAYRFEFDRAYPVKWQGPSLKSGENALAVESIELAHHGVVVYKGK